MPRLDIGKRRAALVLGTLLTLVGGMPGWARAADPADPAQVEELIRQGVELRRAGKDHAAVPLFQKAYDLERSPRTAAQLGLVEASLGYWLAAERHLSEALSFPRHPWLVRNKDEIDKTLRSVQSYIGEVVVTGAPEGAEVLVNGRAVGRLPLAEPVRVAEGPAVVVVRAPGHAPSTSSLKIDGGKRESLRIALQRGEGVGGPVSPGHQAGGGMDTVAEPFGPQGELEARSGRPGWLRPASWGVAAAAAAGLTVGVYGLLQQRSHSKKFSDQKCTTATPDKGGGACAGIYQDAKNAEKLAVIGLVSGGVLAAGAVVGLVLSAGQDDGGSHAANVNRPAKLGWSVAVGHGSAAAGMSLPF